VVTWAETWIEALSRDALEVRVGGTYAVVSYGDVPLVSMQDGTVVAHA
jgi:hypothetical protein